VSSGGCSLGWPPVLARWRQTQVDEAVCLHCSASVERARYTMERTPALTTVGLLRADLSHREGIRDPRVFSSHRLGFHPPELIASG
jgi:hypothetical protein